MRKQLRGGFSLFELLVILAIIGLLLALLLPAVAKVRQAANRAKSQNNLKQIGLACHSYLDANNAFPPGTDDNNFSAAAKLLPYLEQDNVYKQIDFQKPMTDRANEPMRKMVIKLFLSPDDPLDRVTEDSGATNYLFSAGAEFGLEENNGIFYLNSKVRIQDIPDGTSNTLLIGETLKGDGGKKAVDVHRQHVLLKKEDLKNLKEDSGVQDFADNKNIAGDRGACWMDGRFLQGTFTGTRGINDKKPDVNCGGAGGLSALRGLNTFTNIGMCDGSVRTITDKVKPDVIKILAGRNDGQVVPDF
jgi:type II secretory pathway pseudopilin PulG